MQVKTRFAPSPTGHLHIGSIRTALYSWLFARHNNGKFILRIEDTDLDRSKTICIDSILNDLKWLGLHWDEGPYFQTERLNRYKTVIDQMLEKGDAYICLCSLKKLEETRINQIKKGEKPRYIGTCRDLQLQKTCDQDYVIRFKNPLCGKVIFTDQIRGKIIFDNSELDDLIIQRSNGMPTYNFCVVIDDLDMQITHVIRGEDHINNTPRQINILKSLGAKIPFYAHLSMILDEEGHKISKRRNAINILEYRDSGFLPEAILNYIIRLGWSCGNKEIFNILEMQKLFNLQSITKSSSIINIKKLLWMNKYYINHLPINYITKIIKDSLNKKNLNIQNGPSIECVVKLLRNRYYTLNEIAESCKYFYSDFDIFNEKLTEKYLTLKNIFILKKLYQKIEQLSHWEQLSISKIINDVSLELKLNTKKINMILRVIITNNICSPSISSILYLIGKEKTLFRIQKALNYLKKLH